MNEEAKIVLDAISDRAHLWREGVCPLCKSPMDEVNTDKSKGRYTMFKCGCGFFCGKMTKKERVK